MGPLDTIAVETPGRNIGAQLCAGIQRTGRCSTPGESAWRTFRKRLLQNLNTSEWADTKPPDIISSIVEMAQHALAANSCTIILSNGHGHRVFHNNRNGHRTRTTTQRRIDTLCGPAAWVVAQRSPIVLNSATDWAALDSLADSSYDELKARILCVPIEASGVMLGAMEVTRRRQDEPFNARDLDSGRVMGAMAGIAIENAKLRESMEEGYRSTIRALASAIDAKDPYTCGHSQSVAQYSLICGMALNLDADFMQSLETGAVLHDIGKIGIDDAILRKPRRLTAVEHAIIKDYPVIGAAIVHDIGSLSEAVGLILHHHEGYDGSGYPHGIQGEDIRLGARIITVADAFDSMTTDRPYRRGMTINEAMSELLRCRGKQFCPVALDAFAVGFARYYDDLPQRPRVLERHDRVAIPAYAY